MAGWLTELFGSGRRFVAQNFIEKGLRSHLSANSITRSLKDLGLSYRRQNMLRDVKTWKQIIDTGSGMKNIGRSLGIPDHWYMPTTSNFGSRYVTRYLLEMKNPLTGEKREFYPWIKHTHMEQGMEMSDLTQSKTREELEDKLLNVVAYTSEPIASHSSWDVERAYPLYGLKNPYYS